jgi:hypothetical protein
MAELFVRALLPNLGVAQAFEKGDDLPRLERGSLPTTQP